MMVAPLSRAPGTLFGGGFQLDVICHLTVQ